MMKRCFYISNAYDGKYFVLTDNVGEFAQRMAAYLMNLERSGKCNHYSFGSVELSESEYQSHRTEATQTESSRIAATKRPEQQDQQEQEDNFTPPPPSSKDNQSKRPGLRLV